jgi:hypothetical protein
MILCSANVNAQTPVIDSVFMGAGYANQIYYKITSGVTGTQTAANWHIAVSVQPSIPPTQTLQGTTIRINGGYGVEVYKVTNTDSSGFDALNSVDDILNWQQLRDKYNSWDEGCLNQTRNAMNPFDYGWGIYQGNPTYNVVGDSIYVLKLSSNSYKKLWVKKLKFDTLWQIVISTLDNSTVDVLNISKLGPGLQGKNFVYINANTGGISNSEPQEGWDLLFGKYVSEVAPGMYYPVTGVLTNKANKSVKAYPVDINTVSVNDYQALLNSNISNIGYDWKLFSNGSFEIVDSLVYYVSLNTNDVFRLRFLDFRASDGMVKFELIPAAPGGNAPWIKNGLQVQLAPNPASDEVQVKADRNMESISLFDLSGRLHFSISNLNRNNVMIPLNELQPGMYLISCKTADGVGYQKLIKK